MRYVGDLSPLRIVVALLLLVVSGASGGGFRTTGARCTETCRDDDDSGKCPPSCVDCSCCVGAPVVVRTEVISFAGMGVEAQLPVTTPDAMPPQPELRGVDHVPKHASA